MGILDKMSTAVACSALTCTMNIVNVNVPTSPQRSPSSDIRSLRKYLIIFLCSAKNNGSLDYLGNIYKTKM